MPGTVLLTGANGGMARIVAQSYAAQHPEDHLILLVRDPSKLPKGAVQASERVSYLAFDMTSLESVRAASANISSRVTSHALPPIKTIVCCAAVHIASPDQPRVSKDGYEESVAVNHLAHFTLILELLPYMSKGGDGQVIIVGSDSHRPDYKFMQKHTLYRPLKELVDVEAGSEPAKDAVVNGFQRYGTSKLLQMMTGHELARRLKSSPTYSSIRVAMFDPGSMATSLLRDYPYIQRFLMGYAFRFPNVINYLDPAFQVSLPETSAASLVKIMEDRKWAEAAPLGTAADPQVGGAPTYLPWGEKTQTYGEANEPGKCRERWDDSAELLGYKGEKALA